MYAIYQSAAGIAGTHLPVRRERVLVTPAVFEDVEVEPGRAEARMITPAVAEAVTTEAEDGLSRVEWQTVTPAVYETVDVPPRIETRIVAEAVYRDETTDELIQRLNNAGHLPDAPWLHWLVIPSDDPIAAIAPSRLTVGDWSNPAAIGIAPEVIVYTQEDYERAIDRHIETTARLRQYGSAVALASYTVSTVPTWAAEALAFVAWRDAIWGYAYQQLAAVQAQQRPQPTPTQFVSELAPMVWP